MFTNEEITADQITRIADAIGTPAEDSGTVTGQLARIADALERIAAALDAQKWETKDSREPFNIHSLLLLISQKL